MKAWSAFVLSILFFLSPAISSGEMYKNVSEVRLSNGLKVIMIENHSSPAVCFQVWYRAGARDEKTGKTGLAHMVERMMFTGTRKVSGAEFAKTIHDLGGEQTAITSHDYTCYSETLAPDRIGVAIGLEADRMSNLLLKESDFQTEKMAVLKERRTRIDDDPGSFLLEQLHAAAYQSQPYRWPVMGWADDIDRLTLSDVKAFYSKYYNPANAFVVVTGDFKKQDLIHRMEKTFGKIPAGKPAPRLLIRDPPQPGERRVIVECPARVGSMVVAWHVPNLRSGDSYVLEVIKAILAEGMNSRLYDHLVRDEALVLQASAHYSLTTQDPGLFYIYVSFLPEKNPGQVEQAICEELELLKTTPVGVRELEKAKNHLEAAFVYGQESIFSLGRKLAQYEIALDWSCIAAYVPSIRSVTPQEIQRVASRYFTAQNRNVGILVPTGPLPRTSQAFPRPSSGVGERSIRLRAPDFPDEVVR